MLAEANFLPAGMAVLSSDQDGFSCITGATLQKAIDELNENPATRASKVRELRDRILIKETELRVSSKFQ